MILPRGEPGRTKRERLLYDEWHHRLGASEGGAGNLRFPWHRTVARLLPELADQRVLEIGCGRGDFAAWLAARHPSADVAAVDFSDAAIAIARGNAASAGVSVRFEVQDAEALNFPDAVFDWVITCECLEHVEHPDRMAREIRRVLKPGGRFVLTTENYFNGMILAWIKTWVDGSPFDSGSGVQPRESFFLFWRVQRLLEEGGLRVDHSESSWFQWLLLPGVDPARLATPDFENPTVKKLLRPFGRHFTFRGLRP